jgi:hypothetical protein
MSNVYSIKKLKQTSTIFDHYAYKLINYSYYLLDIFIIIKIFEKNRIYPSLKRDFAKWSAIKEDFIK